MINNYARSHTTPNALQVQLSMSMVMEQLWTQVKLNERGVVQDGNYVLYWSLSILLLMIECSMIHDYIYILLKPLAAVRITR